MNLYTSIKKILFTKIIKQSLYTISILTINYILIKNSDKLQKFFKMKELNDGVMRMALINRQFVTKNALDKDHPFFNRTQPD